MWYTYHTHTIFFFSFFSIGAGRMAEWLKVLADGLLEDWVWFPAPTSWRTPSLTPVSWSAGLFCPVQAAGTQVFHRCPCRQNHREKAERSFIQLVTGSHTTLCLPHPAYFSSSWMYQEVTVRDWLFLSRFVSVW